MTDFLINEDSRFTYSGEPSKLEHYECYHDPSRSDMTTGKELLELEKEPFWTKEHRKVWLYFYRPYNYGNNIGRKQREERKERESNVSAYQENIATNNMLRFITIFFIVVTLIISIVYQNIWLLAISVIFYIYLYFQNIALEINIKKDLIIIEVLDNEINYLLKQKDEMSEEKYTSSEVEEIFWKDINSLEGQYIEKASHEDGSNIREFAPNFYRSMSSKERHQFPTFPVIPSWAFLQPSQKNTRNRKEQSTGLKIAADKIGEKVATWRNVKGKRPIFRLWYIQFLFFHEKNLSLMSFYYDFVTKITYSEHQQFPP